jgi:hypothetical protein
MLQTGMAERMQIVVGGVRAPRPQFKANLLLKNSCRAQLGGEDYRVVTLRESPRVLFLIQSFAIFV